MTNPIEVTFLQQADETTLADQVKGVAEMLADFVNQAKQSLHIAIYDFRLGPVTAPIVLGALNQTADRGVSVRIAYFKPKTKRKTTDDFALAGNDPAPGPDEAFLGKLHPAIAKKAIEEDFDVQKDTGPLDKSIGEAGIDGGGHLMHSKYIIRDGLAPDGAVWTGSTNFTDDAWGRQENNIITVASQDLCGFYETDFAELWASDRISGTGKNDLGTADVEGTRVSVAFAPGEGRTIDTEIAGRISAAKNEVVIASMVISSAKIMGALIDAADRGVTIRGIYDGTEMEGVEKAWSKSGSPTSAAKLAQWNHIKTLLVPKFSTPYSPTSHHDFMHNKTVVLDSAAVASGSFNFSLNATANAENILTIESTEIAASYVKYIDAITARYKAQPRSDEQSSPATDAPSGHLQRRRTQGGSARHVRKS